jgi:hypothetical protein
MQWMVLVCTDAQRAAYREDLALIIQGDEAHPPTEGKEDAIATLNMPAAAVTTGTSAAAPAPAAAHLASLSVNGQDDGCCRTTLEVGAP